jgi:protein-arginine kinase activator protein McsA
LALRFKAPMFVDEKVMEKAGIVMTKENAQETQEENGEPSKVSPLDTLKEKLERAIREERYEDAAVLRDEINKMANSN